MTYIVLGLAIWVIAHLIPVAFVNVRSALVNKLGALPYRGLFALTVLASVGLIIFGWRSIESVTPLYDITEYAAAPALILIICGFVLMAAAKLKSNFKRTFRHPQLLGFSLWAFAHLLLNGDLRAVVLFGTLFVWAKVTMILSSKRDGEYVKPAKEPPHKGVIVVAVGISVFIGVAMIHEYIAGVPLAPH